VPQKKLLKKLEKRRKNFQRTTYVQFIRIMNAKFKELKKSKKINMQYLDLRINRNLKIKILDLSGILNSGYLGFIRIFLKVLFISTTFSFEPNNISKRVLK
jgi:hypothetical protein